MNELKEENKQLQENLKVNKQVINSLINKQNGLNNSEEFNMTDVDEIEIEDKFNKLP